MSRADKPIAWLSGEVKTPPFTKEARLEAGYLLRLLQRGERLSLPHSRLMPVISPRRHELRINDAGAAFRIIYRIDRDAIVIADVFKKKTARTPQNVIAACRRRLLGYDLLASDEGE